MVGTRSETDLFDCGGFLGCDAVHLEPSFHGRRLARLLVVEPVGLKASTVRGVGRRLLAAVAVAVRDLGRRGGGDSRLLEFHLGRFATAAVGVAIRVVDVVVVEGGQTSGRIDREIVVHVDDGQFGAIATDHVQSFQ